MLYLHSSGVIHADIKCVGCHCCQSRAAVTKLPQDNILVGNDGCARLTDFGRSKVIGEDGYSTAIVAGLAAYMAPELHWQTEDDVIPDKFFSTASDVYAFGMLCFEVRPD